MQASTNQGGWQHKAGRERISSQEEDLKRYGVEGWLLANLVMPTAFGPLYNMRKMYCALLVLGSFTAV